MKIVFSKKDRIKLLKASKRLVEKDLWIGLSEKIYKNKKKYDRKKRWDRNEGE